MANLNLSQEKLAALRSEYKHRNVRGKYPRQKMLPEYRCIYPWVLPDETDPYYTFCTVCECRLSAKRSDLGKHEGSIKHTENATRKGLMHSADRTGVVLSRRQQTVSLESSDSAAEITVSDEDDDGDEDNDDDDNDDDEEREEKHNVVDDIYVKQEPVVDIIETSNNAINFDVLNSHNRNSQDTQPDCAKQTVEDDESDVDDGDNADDNENEGDDESCTPPLTKRFASDLSSQSLRPAEIKIRTSEAAVHQSFSIRKVLHQNDDVKGALHMPVQTPCKITIKKISTPIATVSQVTSIVTPMATTITPVPIVSSALNISNQQSPILPRMTTSPAVTCLTTSLLPTTPPVRDSFDLFFDSICATVKTLPPKLATEGKVRVMQLIGELEIRAITERETSQPSTSGQQNSTVASTTK